MCFFRGALERQWGMLYDEVKSCFSHFIRSHCILWNIKSHICTAERNIQRSIKELAQDGLLRMFILADERMAVRINANKSQVLSRQAVSHRSFTFMSKNPL